MLEDLYAEIGRRVPPALHDWSRRVDDWCSAYLASFGDAELLQIIVTPAVFVFDRTHERVAIAYGLSTPDVPIRDSSRMRGSPDPNPGVQTVLRESA
jgi:hypothetical protein